MDGFLRLSVGGNCQDPGIESHPAVWLIELKRTLQADAEFMELNVQNGKRTAVPSILNRFPSPPRSLKGHTNPPPLAGASVSIVCRSFLIESSAGIDAPPFSYFMAQSDHDVVIQRIDPQPPTILVSPPVPAQ